MKKNKKNLDKSLHIPKKLRTFASQLRNHSSDCLANEFWRDVRVVECAGLENRCTERYRGFESLSLREKEVERLPFFVFVARWHFK